MQIINYYMNIKNYIRDIADFPKPGIVFKDISPLLSNPEAFNFVVDNLAEQVISAGSTAVVGIEARGFIIGAPVAVKTGLPFIPVRKPKKLPFKTLREEYALEYGIDAIEMHVDAVGKNDMVAIVDDVLATGGTAEAAVKLVKQTGAEISCLCFLMELSFLEGRGRFQKDGYNIGSIIQY